MNCNWLSLAAMARKRSDGAGDSNHMAAIGCACGDRVWMGVRVGAAGYRWLMTDREKAERLLEAFEAAQHARNERDRLQGIYDDPRQSRPNAASLSSAYDRYSYALQELFDAVRECREQQAD